MGTSSDQAVSLTRATPDHSNALLSYMRALRVDDPMPVHEFASEDVVRKAMVHLIGEESAGRVWLIERHEKPVGYLALTFCFILEFGGRCAFLRA